VSVARNAVRPISIGSRGAAFDRQYVENAFGVVQAKENPPVADAPAKPVLAPQVLYFSEERIHLHAVDGCTDAGPVVGRRAVK
jgi:hypothetical protein